MRNRDNRFREGACEESLSLAERKGNLFSLDGDSEVRSRVRRGVLSLRVVLQMLT